MPRKLCLLRQLLFSMFLPPAKILFCFSFSGNRENYFLCFICRKNILEKIADVTSEKIKSKNNNWNNHNSDDYFYELVYYNHLKLEKIFNFVHKCLTLRTDCEYDYHQYHQNSECDEYPRKIFSYHSSFPPHENSKCTRLINVFDLTVCFDKILLTTFANFSITDNT